MNDERKKWKRWTIEEIQQLAISRGGKLISTKYNNSHEKLIWQCNEGHEWSAPMKAMNGQLQ